PISSLNPDITTTSFMQVIINWLLGVCLIISALMGTGKIIFGSLEKGIFLLIISLVMAVTLYFRMKKEFSDID
ncbi:MAG: hypothetical protein ACR2NC_03500, partial [Thermodesulfobacteriota bacterium]